MHAEYYTLNGNHIKEEIIYFQKMCLAVGKWVSLRPLIVNELNWWIYNLLLEQDRLFLNLILRQLSSIKMEIFHLRLRYWYNCLQKCIFLLLANVRLLLELCHYLIYFDLIFWGWLCKFPQGRTWQQLNIYLFVSFAFYFSNTRVARKCN